MVASKFARFISIWLQSMGNTAA